MAELCIDEALLHALCCVAHAGGCAILPYANDPQSRSKTDGSPVTAADLAAHRVIVQALQKHYPDVRCLSEEDAQHPDPVTLKSRLFFLIDPLDGTREFINGNGEFTVNVALIRQGRPVAGVVHAPVTGECWWGAADVGAWRTLLPAGSADARDVEAALHQRVALQADSPENPDGWVVTSSRSHGDETALREWLTGLRVAKQVPAGSSLKFCRIAEGQADLYPRLGPTMEWDTAAGQAVLEAAGGWVCNLQGQPLVYAQRDGDFRNPHFVAGGRGLSPQQALRRV